MIKLGVSLYPEQETMEEIENYLALASKYGFTKVFTSMFSVPGEKEEVAAYFKNLSAMVHKYGMVLDGDCNTNFLEKMGASEKDLTPFKEMGIDIIRMDFPYFDERDVTLINNDCGIKIELSSALTGVVEAAIKNGANPKQFGTCHNFYPGRYTGASIEDIRPVNRKLHELGIPTTVFISSHVEGAHGPWPVTDGLPTLEDHRWLPVDLQVRHLIAMGDVDEVIFGNAFASEEEFKAVADVMKAAYPILPKFTGELASFEFLANMLPQGPIERVPFKVELTEGVTDLEKEIVFNCNAHAAGEYTYYMIRCRWSRMIYGKQSIPERKCDQEVFHRGDVVVINDNLAHYRGEVQVVLKDIKNDGQRNLIGRIPVEEHILLDEIHAGDKVCFLTL